MTATSSLSQPPGQTRIAGLPVALFGLWLGLVYGVIEALEAMLWTLIPGGLSWQNGTAPPILWVAPLVYGAAFGLIGILVAGLSKLLPRVRWDLVLVFLLVATGAYLATSLQRLILDERACLLLGLGFGVALIRVYRSRPEWSLATARRTLPWVLAAIALTALVITAGTRLAEGRRIAC